MKTPSIILTLFILFFANTLISAIPPRTPYVVLRINGKEYQPNSEIVVRPGERIRILAVLMGGRRDYCSQPEKYANVGKNTVIDSKSENSMSFHIGDGTFRGTWSLTSETAVFTSANEVKITMENAVNKIQTEAIVEVPQSGFSKIFIKVKSETKWHYIKNTQAGQSEQDETNNGESTFYLKLEGVEGAWYSSANIIAKGKENFSVRNSLDDIQRFYKEIENRLLKKDFDGAKQQIDNLKNSISSLKSVIDREKEKDPAYVCEITFVGLPTSLTMKHLQKLQTMADKWMEMYLIAQGNVTKINEMLLNAQNGFSANVLRSVFKNYINWGTSIPTGGADLLTLYDPNNVLVPFDMPRKVMEWWEEANNDASILQQQAQTIKMLSQLRKFYIERMTKFGEERKEFYKIINELKPVKGFDSSLKQYFQSIGWAKFQNN